MESELADIGLLQTMQIECADTQTQLEKWLTTKPTVANLIDIRKIIKGLKSRLRHRLADKQDLEEVQCRTSLNKLEDLHFFCWLVPKS